MMILLAADKQFLPLVAGIHASVEAARQAVAEQQAA